MSFPKAPPTGAADKFHNLEDLLRSIPSPVEMLRNAQVGPNVYPGVPAEFTNWRDEQWAWQHTCVLFNQSYHMADLAVEGPGALALLSHLGVNTFENFAVDKAKQFVPCTPSGYVIGDVILFHLAEQEFNLVGRAPVLNWVTYHAQTGNYDVEVALDQRWALRTDGRRRSFRFQLQGPNAMDVIGRVLGVTPPELKFFNLTDVQIAGRDVRALRHGMVGQPGWELFGPWDDGEAVREAILAAGAEFGLRQAGGRAYSSNALESGWIPSPLPAVYTRDELRSYREWLPANGYEGSASIGGSFVSSDIEDYYFTPWDLGYGHLVKFDHDFIGREALEEMAGDEHRHKVTLALDDEDVAETIATMFQKTDRAKFIDWPSAVYSMHPFDRVTVNGDMVGVSTWFGYSYNEAKMLTLAVVDADHAKPGTEVSLVWGEENGGTAKPTVEPHVQREIRAVVSPVPYVEVVRQSYAPDSWRSAAV
jgi:glycine cleavage system aminomethyltransferase T